MAMFDTQREQLAEHEERAARLEEELAALRHARDNTPHARDKDHYLMYEVRTNGTASLIPYYRYLLHSQIHFQTN
jgi:hypothetical protein